MFWCLTIAELSAEPGNSIADGISTEQLEWLAGTAECEDNYQSGAIGMASFTGVATDGNGFITTQVVNSGSNNPLLKINLNIDNLMTEIINRLGGVPIVNNITITSNGTDITGQYVPTGSEITVDLTENGTVTGLVDSGNNPISLGQDGNGHYVGTGTVTGDVSITTSSGTSTIASIGPSDSTLGVAPAPGVASAVVFTYLLDDGGPLLVYKFDSVCNATNGATTRVTTLHLSKAGEVIEVDANDQDPLVGQRVSEISVNGSGFSDTYVSFAGVTPGTIVKAYVTTTCEFAGEPDPTVFKSKTVFFKIPEPLVPNVQP